ncbi:MAG: hypothetical protein ACI9XC_002421 [Gammaproteobacteria bacterium]|jgi:hypothetical protein
MNIKKLFLMFVLLFFNNAVWSDTFELVCDIKNGPMTQGRYRFDTDSKTVSEIGYYSGENYSEKISNVYKTIGWNLEEDMLIWVSNNFEASNEELHEPVKRSFDIIVFDLRNMYITFSRSARKGGLIEHILDFTEKCVRD